MDELMILDKQAVRAVGTRVGLEGKDMDAFATMVLGPVHAMSMKVSGDAASSVRTDYASISHLLPGHGWDPKYPPGPPDRLEVWPSPEQWNEWRYRAEAWFSYVLSDEWVIGPENIEYDWLEENVHEVWVD